MLTHTTRWSHPPGNAVVPSPWQATVRVRLPFWRYELRWQRPLTPLPTPLPRVSRDTAPALRSPCEAGVSSDVTAGRRRLVPRRTSGEG